MTPWNSGSSVCLAGAGRGVAAAVAAVLAALVCAAGCQPPSPPGPAEGPDRPQRLPTATIRVGDTPLVVEVAREESERQMGMMFRRSLGPDEAMLFVFERDANLAFWMRNTYVDLDLAYVAADGTIVQVERMKTLVPDGVYSREPARFVLEAPAGWFERHGVAVGTKIAIPPEVAGAAGGDGP